MKLLGGLVITLALVLATGVGAAEAAYAPPGGATFNVPRPWGTSAQRWHVVRTVDTAIRNVRPTSWDPHPVIYISLFLLDDKPSVDALIGARNRGVSVRVVLDPDIIGHQANRLTRALNRDNHPAVNGPITSNPLTWGKDQSYVLRCQGSCRGGGGNVHTKFYAFSHTGSVKNVVMVSSSNLNKIRCGSAFGRTRINVSMFYWSGARGQYLASKLIALGRAGCQVSVIYGAPSKAVRLQLRAAAVKHLITVYDSRWDLDYNGTYDVRTHGKYVLVKGTFGGNRSAHLVMTGSQNWVGGSLSIGDEVTLNIALTSAYNRYIRNWDLIRRHSRHIPQSR